MSPIVNAGVYPHPPLIIPDIGGEEAITISSTKNAMEEMARRVKLSRADTLLVITPHGPIFHDAIAILGNDTLSGSFERFAAGHVSFSFHNDKRLLEAIESEADRINIRTGVIDNKRAQAYGVSAKLDHGTLVPIYFLQEAGVNLPMVHITFGLLPPKSLFAFGQAIQRAINRLKRRVAVVATADFSHRLTPDAPAGFSPAGEEFDRKLVELLGKYDVAGILSMNPRLVEEAAECGYRSLLICLGMLEGLPVDPEILSYEGPFGVGYLVADLSPGITRQQANRATWHESEHVKLARQALETFVLSKEFIDPPAKSTLTGTRAGSFVSLKIAGNLRGCIGTIEPTQENLAAEIIENAISAGFYDPRFPAVTSEELPAITYSVDVLSPAEEITSISELNPKKYGVIVECGSKRGLLLPDLEGVDTKEKQLLIALQKAGLSQSDNFRMFRFEVKRYT